MTPILYEATEIDFNHNGLGLLTEMYNVDVAEQRNGLFQLTAIYPTDGRLYKGMIVGNIILAKPNTTDNLHAFRIVVSDLDVFTNTVRIEADSITYDLTHNLIKHVVLNGDGQTAMSQLQTATMNPHLFTFSSDILHTSESTLDMVNPMEAIAGTQGSFLQYWGGELKRENRKVSMLSRRGRDNVTTFRLGKNISGLKYTVDMGGLVTQILPYYPKTATSEEAVQNVYGKIGNSQYMGNYPTIYLQKVDVSQQITVLETDTDSDIENKINDYAKDWFTKSQNTDVDKPKVTVDVNVLSLQDSSDYQEKFKDLETVELTDTVTVYVPEFDINVTAIVNECHYDPMSERLVSLVIGAQKVSFTDANHNALNEMQDKINEIHEDANTAVESANGKNTIFRGRDTPAHPVEGDLWYWQNGDESGIRIFEKDNWEEVVDSNTQQRITDEVDNAIEEAKKYTDNKKIVLDGTVVVTGDFYAKGGNFKNLNASNMTTGTLNAADVNLINLNADSITTGTIKGPNLSINLLNGTVTFQKGRLYSTTGTIDMNIDQGYLSVANNNSSTGNNILIRNGEIAFTQPNLFDPSKDPYLRLTNRIVNSSFASGSLQARYGFELNIKGNESSVVDMGIQTLAGIKFGKGNDGKLERTLVGGGNQGVKISGGTATTDMFKNSPSIVVGQNKTQDGAGNRVFINAEYLHAFSVYGKTTSSGGNVFVSSDGALVRSTSARKYKKNIKRDVPLVDSETLLQVPLSTWEDKAEIQRSGHSQRYFGMIAEDLADAGLDYLVTRDDEGTIEGIEYARVALLLIPLVKKLKEEVEELKNARKES